MREKLTTSIARYPLPKWESYSQNFDEFLYTSSGAAYNKAVELSQNYEIVIKTGIDKEITSFVHIVRSDETLNPIVNGWRAPSAYSFSKDTVEGATIVQSDHFQGDPGTSYKWVKPNSWTASKRYYFPRVAWNVDPRQAVLTPLSVVAPPDIGEGAIITAMAKQVKSEGMNAALALAESRQTAQLLSQKLTQLAGIIKAVRKKNPKVLFETWRKIRKSSAPSRAWKDLTLNQRKIQKGRWKNENWRKTRTAADEWLSFIYGVMPIVYDIEALLEQLEQGIREKDQLLIARASVRHTTETSSTVSAYSQSSRNGSTYQNGIMYEAGVKHVTKHRHAGSLWFKVEDPTAVILKSLGFNNALAVAWDMVPLVSLLTDWVIPIGERLSLMDYDHGLTYLGGSFTEFSETTTTVDAPSSQYWELKESGTRKLVKLERKVYHTPPTPPLPSIRNPFRTTRAVSAVALIRQRLR